MLAKTYIYKENNS